MSQTDTHISVKGKHGFGSTKREEGNEVDEGGVTGLQAWMEAAGDRADRALKTAERLHGVLPRERHKKDLDTKGSPPSNEA